MALVQAGIMAQDAAERINRQLDSDAAREWAEQQMLLSFQQALAGQRERLIDAIRANDGLLSAAQQNRLWAGENERFWQSIRDTILDVASERAVVAAVSAGDIDTWNLIDERMVDYAESYYTSAAADNVGSVPNLNQTSRERVGRIVGEWQRGVLPATGLDGLPELIRNLEPVFGASRAESIAVTETTRIFTEGIRAAEADNEFTTQWEWLTSEDEAVCPLCGPRAGMRIAKNAQGFTVGELTTYPPAHPRCRCQIIPLTDAAADGLPDVERVPFAPVPVAEPVEEVAAVSLPYRPAQSAIDAARNAGEENVRRLARSYGVAPDEVEKRLLSQMRRYVDGQVPRLRTNEDAAIAILRDGKIKTQFEVETSGGTFTRKARADAEEIGLGYPQDFDPTKRPVYGYYDTPQHGARMYGQVEFVTKPAVASRTTVTLGDSLYQMQGRRQVGVPANQIGKEAFGDSVAARDLYIDDMSETYIEAQIHDGLTLDDIAEIILHPNSFNAADLARVEKAYKAQGIRVTYGAADED